MELQIQQKLGGIDAILQKAARVNPNIFTEKDSLLNAAAQTKQATASLIEEKKSKRDNPADLSLVFLKGLKKTCQLDCTKKLLKNTKDEVKTLARKREAAKMIAIKSIRAQQVNPKSSKYLSDPTFAQFHQVTALKLDNNKSQQLENQFNKAISLQNYYLKVYNSDCTDEQRFYAYYALWVISKKLTLQQPELNISLPSQQD